MVARTLGHYRLLEPIGSGGMGVVYRGFDERLQRDVAIKVLPEGLLADESARRRFRQEALALSRLNHPAIATVHDFDTQDGADFLVLEHIEGQTLDTRLASGPVPERELLALASQLAAGLEAAHKKGVIHRDLKPGNLRVTPDGRLKILDFGLAKLLEPVVGRSSMATLTDAQHIVGTLPYMSPEQLSGEKVDERTDLYAAGAVLYEMATGRRPFPQAGAAELMYAIINQPPPAPGSTGARVSPGLEGVVLKALEKNPDHRYQSARELRADLDRLSAPSGAVASRIPRKRAGTRRMLAGVLGAALMAVIVAGFWIADPGSWRERLGGGAASGALNSLAVLPLDNLSHDPQQDYFAEGMTDELITCLGKISALRVIARGSIMQYKGTQRPLRDIGRALNVAALLEGTVLRAQDRVRITAQLIQAATGKLLWSESYERSLTDVLALQSEVALSIAKQIQVELTPSEHARLTTAGQVDPKAYEAYLLGRHEWNRSLREDKEKGVDYFKRAIAIDSTYALAYAGLADAYYSISNWWIPPDQAMPLARAAAQKALALDPDLADARAVLGIVEAEYDWDFSRAEADFRRATATGANSTPAHLWYAYYLNQMGRFDEARAQYGQARGLSPLDSYVGWLVVLPDYYQRRFDQAVARLQELIGIDPTYADNYTLLGETREQQGDLAQALVQLRKAESLGTHAWTLAAIGRVQAEAGHRDSALAVIAELARREQHEFVTPYGVASIYAALGDKDHAFESLDKSVRERSEDIMFLKIDPKMDRLRSDPRFAALLRRVGLDHS